MAFLLSFLVTLLLGFAFQYVLPWYGIALAGVLAGVVIHPSKSWHSFISGFLAGLLLWGGYAWWTSMANEHILVNRLSITIANIGTTGLFVLTGLIGALCAGLGAFTGHLGREFFTSRR